jgi:hypothetical protein
MKIKSSGTSHKDKVAQSQKEQPVAAIRILEIRESEGKVFLRVAISFEFYNELNGFLTRNRLTYWGNDRKVIPILLEYGISDDSDEELERQQDEMTKVGSRYAAINFQTAEYYARNSAIAMGLRLHLQENRSLKRKLKKIGLGEYVSEDEWDNWDNNFIDELYRRYVFCK